MTASPAVPLDTRPVTNDTGGRGGCAVCDHELAGHDAIGRRYCQATQAQALPRNCICRIS